jgi:glycerol-3-phosphate dehydrogenase
MKSEYDVIIIGGGINGAGIARELGMRNISTLLVEKGDFGSGTSSQSSKLAHGGLRYLEQGNLKLVYEACHERERLLKNASHIVKPLPFIIPIYKQSSRSRFVIKIGLFIYDLLSSFKTTKSHKMLSKHDVQQAIPALKSDDLVGGALYIDAQMDDSRLVIETILQAEHYTARCKNYTEVIAIKPLSKKSCSVTIKDCFSGEEKTVIAKQVINTGGPWSDIINKMANPDSTPQLRLSKGVHILTEPLSKNAAVLLTTQHDGRVYFVIPWNGYSLIGTTDTDFDGNPDDTRASKEDIQYLLDATQYFFPESALSHKDVITSFAGLRPLIKSDSSTASAVSREHKIIKEGPILSLVGGKFTTFRKMSEDVAKLVCESLTDQPFVSLTRKLPSWGGTPINKTQFAHYRLPAALKNRIVNYYGNQFVRVFSILISDIKMQECLPDSDITIGEIFYIIDTEKAKTITDIMRRRTHLKFSKGSGVAAIDIIGKILQKCLKYPDEVIALQKKDYLNLIKSTT